ncbi:hypothetical protein [Flagellimonas baculiformis]|uniref:hypothetical protein n=1 Tax=Flagellimonas baculiformis TaxID=3067310 RepID=UPI00296FB4F0|nr:hypothetical protein [Muricauda sp. D6]
MKKLGLILTTVALMAMTTYSCRERNPKDPRVEDNMQGVQESQEESSEKYDEWSGRDEADKQRDTTYAEGDTIHRDSTQLRR